MATRWKDAAIQRRRWMLGAAAAVLVLAAGAAILAGRADHRSAAAPRPSASAASPARVVLPGRPGESAIVTDSDQVRAPDGSTYNTIDTAFVQMMIVHHGQAITMADLAAGRAADPGVRALGMRISAAQGPEIDWLRAWLRQRGLPESDSGHDHSGMPGMQSPAELASLASARGADFDHRFVAMMTAHHRGALRMTGDVLAGGTDLSIHETANEMAVEQGSEIRRMAQLELG